MALALEARAAADDILIGDTPKSKRRKGRLKGVKSAGRLWKHSTLADAEGLVSRDEMASFFCFALVRNPWDRVVSYYHWLREQNFEHAAVWLAKTLPFERFIREELVAEGFRQHPYSRYLQDQLGQSHADHFIRIEHLQNDLAPLEAHLGFALDLPWVNRSERGDYRSYYSDDDVAIISDVCSLDIAKFGYSF